MGYWKELESEIYSLSEDLYVCPDCVSDSYLANALAAELEEEPCSYCGAGQAANISVLCEEMSQAIRAYYTDPADVLGYSTREGGYLGETLSGAEIVEGELDDWTECDELRDDVASAFVGHVWCERDYYGAGKYDLLLDGWRYFSDQVKYHTRHLFFQEEDVPSGYSGRVSPSAMLDTLGQLFRDFEMFRELPQSTDLFRARVFNETPRPSTAAKLGTAPRGKTPSNRMSPAGIPMFYAGLDEATAVLEVFDPKVDLDKGLVVARFQNKRPLLLLDLTRLPEVPSVFDPENRGTLPDIVFLRSFEQEFTKPVDREAEGHTEYVPTQVVTEFVRYRLRTDDGKRLDGIIYRSSRHRESTSLVIFADQEHCGPREKELFDPEPFLNLADKHYPRYEAFAKSYSLEVPPICSEESLKLPSPRRS